jgi:hypothetical protein
MHAWSTLTSKFQKVLKNHNNHNYILVNASISIVNTKFVALNRIDSPKELMQHVSM